MNGRKENTGCESYPLPTGDANNPLHMVTFD